MSTRHRKRRVRTDGDKATGNGKVKKVWLTSMWVSYRIQGKQMRVNLIRGRHGQGEGT